MAFDRVGYSFAKLFFLLFLECKISDLNNCLFIKEVSYCHRRVCVKNTREIVLRLIITRLNCLCCIHILKLVYLKVFL